MTDEQLIQRGLAAQHVLQNEMYVEAYDMVDRQLVNLLRSADLAPDKRARINDLLVMGSKYRRVLEHAMQEGRVLLDEIERKRTFRDKVLRRA